MFIDLWWCRVRAQELSCFGLVFVKLDDVGVGCWCRCLFRKAVLSRLGPDFRGRVGRGG